MNRNSTSFQTYLRHFYATNPQSVGKADDPLAGYLRYYQYTIYAYMKAALKNDIRHDARGLLLYHEPGMGKTILAVALAHMLKEIGYDVLVFATKTLESNMTENINKMRRDIPELNILPKSMRTKSGTISDKDFDFVSTNSSNLVEQIKRMAVNTKGADLSKIRLRDVLKGRVIIIDEAHILANSITNGSQQAVQLYEELIACGNSIYIFFLTGSFLINSPFESVPLINMLLGKNYLPAEREKFDALFRTVELLKENQNILMNACSGLISVANIDRNDEAMKINFPEELRTKVIDIPMRGEQSAMYIAARNQELEEQKRWAIGKTSPKGKKGLAFQKNEDVASTYRIRSRMASNGINKWKWITDDILSHPDQIILVCMPFLSEGGIQDFLKYFIPTSKYRELIVNSNGVTVSGPPELMDGLKLVGSKEFKPKKRKPLGQKKRTVGFGENDHILEFDKREKPDSINAQEEIIAPIEEFKDAKHNPEVIPNDRRYYCVFTGDTEMKVRQHLINIMSDPKNVRGKFCHVMFASMTGATGIDLKNGRRVILAQPFWHMELFNQLKHRFIRFGSANALPSEERNVQPIILRSTLEPERDNLTGKVVERPTTDIDLFNMGMKKVRLNLAFIDILKRVSVECLAGVSQDPKICRVCLANNKQLSTGDFYQDQYLPNSCVDLDNYIKPEDSIPADNLEGLTEIIYEFRPWYYKLVGGEYVIYEFVPEKNKLFKINRIHPYYPPVRKLIAN